MHLTGGTTQSLTGTYDAAAKGLGLSGGGFVDDSFVLGKFVLAPYLWHERISRIDTVVLTHPHPDHLQGLLFILENFHVREVWTNGDTSDTELYLSFRRIIREKGIVLRTLSDRTPAYRPNTNGGAHRSSAANDTRKGSSVNDATNSGPAATATPSPRTVEVKAASSTRP